ncbi:MAG TPA: hypothetical protein VD995_09680 [Azospirillum sp.]|nr:hypothetical protein [Azospirillum sp.]
MMKRTCLLAVMAGTLMAAPAAFAQTSGSSGVDFGAPSGQMAQGRILLDLDRIPDGDQRRGPGQIPRELMATTLLNNFSGYGFTAVRNFQKAGTNYVADVRHRDGRWMTVQLDPISGTISTMR